MVTILGVSVAHKAQVFADEVARGQNLAREAKPILKEQSRIMREKTDAVGTLRCSTVVQMLRMKTEMLRGECQSVIEEIERQQAQVEQATGNSPS